MHVGGEERAQLNKLGVQYLDTFSVLLERMTTCNLTIHTIRSGQSIRLWNDYATGEPSMQSASSLGIS